MGNPKKTGSGSKKRSSKRVDENQSIAQRIFSVITSSKTLVPFLSSTIQMITGLVMVSITILGIIQPLWLSAVLSLLGSITAMLGVFLMYHTFSSQDSFESIVNRAIRRAIRNQN
jgi:uncharacterized membrane protein